MIAHAAMPLGFVSISSPAHAALSEHCVRPATLLKRHANCDWGDISQAAQQRNRRALRDGSRIHSAYALPDKTCVWIITDTVPVSRRFITTIMRPEDYWDYFLPVI